MELRKLPGAWFHSRTSWLARTDARRTALFNHWNINDSSFPVRVENAALATRSNLGTMYCRVRKYLVATCLVLLLVTGLLAVCVMPLLSLNRHGDSRVYCSPSRASSASSLDNSGATSVIVLYEFSAALHCSPDCLVARTLPKCGLSIRRLGGGEKGLSRN